MLERVKIEKTFSSSDLISAEIEIERSGAKRVVSGVCTGLNGRLAVDGFELEPYALLTDNGTPDPRTNLSTLKLTITDGGEREEYNGVMKVFHSSEIDWTNDAIFGVAGLNLVLDEPEYEFQIGEAIYRICKKCGNTDYWFSVLFLEQSNKTQAEYRILTRDHTNSDLFHDFYRQVKILLAELRIPSLGELIIAKTY